MFEKLTGHTRVHVPFTALNTVHRLIDTASLTILDVGCGRGESMLGLRSYLTANTVGVDTFRPYLKHCQQSILHDAHVQGDALRLPFRDRSFDTVLSLEVLEHVEKKDALLFLSELERVARIQVILTTPNGHFHLDAFDGNPYQQHRSEWSPTEMRALGYRVIGRGVRGLGGIMHSTRSLAKWTRPLQYFLWIGAGPLASVVPGLAGDLVCIKSVQ